MIVPMMSDAEMVLRQHSPLGASAAARYIHCPGSVRLAEKIRPGFPSVEADYTRHGTAAHKMVAYCLSNYLDAWEAMDHDWGCEFSFVEIEAMQWFIDLVRQRIRVFKEAYDGQSVSIFIEFPTHRPELHELFYGKLDVGIVAGDEAEIIDYKHGAGVAVDVENNPQLQMYGVGFVLEMPEVRKVRLRIGQPRAYHPDGPDRSWEIEVPELMHWLDTVLLPAMEWADPGFPLGPDEAEPPLTPGEWCRFCPAKRQCPALDKQVKLVEIANVQEGMSNELLGDLYAMLPTVKMRIAAIETEVHARNLRDPTNLVPGTKLVAAKSNRIWKDDAEINIVRVLGLDAYEPAKLKSPAKLEELGAKAKPLTKQWAYSPDAGYTTASISDKRKVVSLQKPVEAYQAYLEQS